MRRSTMSKSWRSARALALLAASMPAVAQYVTTPQPEPNPPPGTENLTLTPKNGQSQQQQWTDRYECHQWAVNQSGFDPTRKTAPGGSGVEQYQRALSACLEGRGYTVHYAAP